MEVHRRFSRAAALTAVAITTGVCTMVLATGSRAAPRAQAALAACHVTQTRSLGGTAPTKVRFVNDRASAVGVYWLNFTGYLVYYETIAPHASFTQSTFRSNAWVMLNGAFSCVGYVVTSAAPQYVIH